MAPMPVAYEMIGVTAATGVFLNDPKLRTTYDFQLPSACRSPAGPHAAWATAQRLVVILLHFSYPISGVLSAGYVHATS